MSTEDKNSSHACTADINIELVDWNDESPIFSKTTYTASIKETIKQDEVIAYDILATDKDADDIVEYVSAFIFTSYMYIL